MCTLKKSFWLLCGKLVRGSQSNKGRPIANASRKTREDGNLV